MFPIRINAYLAQQKHCTRREADVFIKAGKVLLNGRVARLGELVQEGDKVEVRFRARTYRYYAYHKPRGIITHSPQQGEKEIADVTGVRGIYPVGRLDKDSSGLILLTDDGRIVERLLHPDFDHEKEYVITTKEPLARNFKERMERGVRIEGYTTKPCRVRLLGPQRFAMILTEGKKHQIRRMCAALGNTIADLVRTRVMNIELRDLKVGALRPIEGTERAELLRSLGL